MGFVGGGSVTNEFYTLRSLWVGAGIEVSGRVPLGVNELVQPGYG